MALMIAAVFAVVPEAREGVEATRRPLNAEERRLRDWQREQARRWG